MNDIDNISDEQIMKFLLKKLMGEYGKKSIDEDILPRLPGAKPKVVVEETKVGEMPLGELDEKLEGLSDEDCEEMGEDDENYIPNGLLERMNIKRKPTSME